MEISSRIDVETGICMVCIQGEFRRPVDSDKLKQFALEFSVKHSCNRFLFDLTQAKVMGGIMAVYSAGAPATELYWGLHSIKTAFVRVELTEEDRFFETVATNRGFQLRAYASVEKAIEWLRQGS